MSACHHRHQVVTHQMIAHINYIILLPDIASSFGIPSRKGFYRALKNTQSFSSQFNKTVPHRRLGYFCSATTRWSFYTHLFSTTTPNRAHTQNNLFIPSFSISHTFNVTSNRSTQLHTSPPPS